MIGAPNGEQCVRFRFARHCDACRTMFSMKETLQIEEHGALGDGRAVLLCYDHDKKRLERLLSEGGVVVGWVDGFYRVLVPGGVR